MTVTLEPQPRCQPVANFISLLRNSVMTEPALREKRKRKTLKWLSKNISIEMINYSVNQYLPVVRSECQILKSSWTQGLCRFLSMMICYNFITCNIDEICKWHVFVKISMLCKWRSKSWCSSHHFHTFWFHVLPGHNSESQASTTIYKRWENRYQSTTVTWHCRRE